jgi:hypothetical protein
LRVGGKLGDWWKVVCDASLTCLLVPLMMGRLVRIRASLTDFHVSRWRWSFSRSKWASRDDSERCKTTGSQIGGNGVQSRAVVALSVSEDASFKLPEPVLMNLSGVNFKYFTGPFVRVKQ